MLIVASHLITDFNKMSDGILCQSQSGHKSGVFLLPRTIYRHLSQVWCYKYKVFIKINCLFKYLAFETLLDCFWPYMFLFVL